MGRALSCTNLWVHFVCHHLWDTIVVLEEGEQPYSICTRCNMFIPWRDMNRSHPAMAMCARVVDSKNQRLVGEDTRAVVATALQAYEHPLALA